MTIIKRVKEVLEQENNGDNINKFLSDVRDSLATSNKHFIVYKTLIIGSIITYHIVVYGGGTNFPVGGVQMTDTNLFRKTYLILPAALLVAHAGVGYLRRMQREVYDYLQIAQARILGQTGFHELRLPSDYILGLFILRQEEGIFARIVVRIVMLLMILVFSIVPVAYIASETVVNLKLFGFQDMIALFSASISIILSICSVIIIHFGSQVRIT